MNPESTQILRSLLTAGRVAALGSLQDGAPAVSMVPFALSDDRRSVFIHVSGLASHTRNLRTDARVSLMVMAPDVPSALAQALARVTVQGEARFLPRSEGAYAEAKACYLAKFPEAAELFEFPDFELVDIEITEARLVAGFGRAHTLYPSDLVRHLADGAVPPGADAG